MRHRWRTLAIRVLVGGVGIPVGWKVLPAEQEGSWRPHWEALLKLLGPSVPHEWEVIVLADRGLYARWLWDCIVAQGWHPASRASIWGQRRVRWAASRSSGSAIGSRRLARAGKARWSGLRAKPVGSWRPS